MFNLSFSPPEVYMTFPDEFKGQIIAFNYNSLQEEQVQPPTGFPDSIYRLTKITFEERFPGKKVEILGGSTLQHISDNIEDIDFLIVPRFQRQTGYFKADKRNFLVVRNIRDTKYSDPMIVTLDPQRSTYDEVLAFINRLADLVRDHP